MAMGLSEAKTAVLQRSRQEGPFNYHMPDKSLINTDAWEVRLKEGGYPNFAYGFSSRNRNGSHTEGSPPLDSL